ncbi:hypothetical protein VRRI112168_08260 [Vreelandella rituensis]|uniref:Uncharacterized protein n=1 Tax=Vreelandella rituensis TaxID=2282306 RepID=A0A368TZF8_9GAMM|nr:hypothetical protein [Halomonas rituensis]RCV89971.1 hypothetical protein DU506_12220 [Halomonas rituensis]
MSLRDGRLLTRSQRLIGWLILTLLASFSPLASAFHDGDDQPQHLDIYSSDDDEVQLFARVVPLTAEASEEFFAIVSGQGETERESQLTLYLDLLPSSLDGLSTGDVLAAAVTPPERLYHEPWQDTLWQPSAKERLAWDGLLHRVIALEEIDDGWQLRLERATLADAIEQGTLIIEAKTMIRSRNEMFGLEPHIYAEGDHYRKVGLHTAELHCTPGRFQVDTVERIVFPYGVEADIAYSAVLHLTYALTFDNGQVERVELNTDICQAGSLKVRVENEVDEEWLLWKERSRPTVFRVGWLPIVARAGAGLTYALETGAGFRQQEPVLLKHHLQRQTSWSQGDWRFDGPELTPPAVHVPDPSLYIDVETTSKLIPQLEIILYGLAGPYIQAPGSTTLGWHSNPSGPSLHANLTLQAGIQQTHPVISLCKQGDCEKILGSCEWQWDFSHHAFNDRKCE